MLKAKQWWPGAVVLFFALGLIVQSAPAGEQKKELVFTCYPDTAEWLMLEVMSRVGREYARAHPGAPRVRLEPGLTYRAARNQVSDGSAAGMLITEQINKMRAGIIFKVGKDGRGRGFERMALNRYVPVAKRVIRSETEVLAEVRLGFATDELTPELEAFLEFLSSEQAVAAIRNVRFVEPVERRAEPEPVTEVPYKPYKSGVTVTLKEPILTY